MERVMVSTPAGLAATLKGAHGGDGPARPLSWERVLDAALRLVDADGLAALSMRRLGAVLGVEAMSLYHHVPCKDALLDGLVERLWAEVRLPADAADWKVAVQAFARSLRGLAQAHPHAYALVLTRGTLPEAAFRALDALLRSLRRAGFDEDGAAEALRTLLAYALGYASVEATCALGRPDLAAACRVAPEVAARFAGVTCALAECNPDAQFEVGLATILAGLEARLGR